jgi:hypothetical protein
MSNRAGEAEKLDNLKKSSGCKGATGTESTSHTSGEDNGRQEQ